MLRILFLILVITSSNILAQIQGKRDVYKYFEFTTITNKLLKQKLEDFRKEIVEKSNNEVEGYIIYYGNRSDIKLAEKKVNLNRLWHCGYDGQICGQIIYVEVPSEKIRNTELWIVPIGAMPPIPKK